MIHGQLYIILACLFGLLMTFGVGANDLANVMSTSMGSKAITVRQAIIIAILFEFAGAFLGGIQVSDTIRHGIINTDVLNSHPEEFIYGMLSVLLAGSTWMFLASYLGLPVSITHTIVGAIVGFGVIKLGMGSIEWNHVKIIAISWVSSPAIAGILSYSLFMSIQWLIFSKLHPFGYVKRYAPLYLFLIGVAISTASVTRGLRHYGVPLNTLDGIMLALFIGLIVMVSGMLLIHKIRLPSYATRQQEFETVEKVFGIMMLFTAAAMVFAHGSNDVAIAVGPIAAVVSVVKANGNLLAQQPIPYWTIALGAGGVVLGLLAYGRNVISTVGHGITNLTPSRAFAATISAAFTVVIATGTGIPVSATQTLVGGVLGVGLARGIGALNLLVIRNIFMSWIITIPAGAFFTIGWYYVLHWILGRTQ
ncbi:MAG: inorganic phosphate transporter [Gammaproteobacteria bacterium]|nr:inorganic phosphate transporter [Gammaproteobacteria bacterium]